MLFPIAKLGNHKYVFHEKYIKNKIILTRGLFFIKKIFIFQIFFVKWQIIYNYLQTTMIEILCNFFSHIANSWCIML